MQRRAKCPENNDKYVGLELEFWGNQTDQPLIVSALGSLNDYINLDWETLTDSGKRGVRG